MLWAHKWKSTGSCVNPTPCPFSNILTHICVSLYFETYFQSAGESGGLSSNSVSRGSPPLLLSSSSQRSLSHRTQWLTARPRDTNWPSVPPSRDKYWGETHSWGNAEIHGGGKDRRRKKRKSKKRWWLWHVTSGSTYCTQVFTFSIPHCLSIRHRSSNHFGNLILLLGKSNWLWNTRCQSTKSLVAFLLLHDHNWSRCSVPDLEENDSQLIAGSSHSRKGFSKRDEYILHRTRVATIWKGPL